MHAVDPTSSSSLSSPYLRLALAVVLLALALLVLVRRLASQYFLVDAGFSGGAMSIGADGGEGAGAGVGAGAGAGGSRIEEEEVEVEVCATCGDSGSKKCSGCKRVRYCSQQCQTKHWRADHKFECKQMRLHLHQPSCKITNQVLFPYDEFLRLFRWEYDEFSPCGLLNCGNSCYANVVLQCLTFTRPLVAYLLNRNHRSGCFRKECCFLCQLQIHVQKVREGRSPFSPMNIFSNLPKFSGNLGYGQQEDAHEFMRVAIDAMQLACLDEFGGEKNLDVSSQETTLIQHIFGGHLRSQVICDECEMVSNRYENMMDLTVEIQGDAESLEQCLDQFTAGEWLDGDNKYKCDGCKDYVKAWKRLTVHQPPNILTIALKRFQSGRFGKLNKRITFPMRLDLTPYTSAGIGDGNDLYDLYAVVVHLDMLNASFFGHYICYIKDRQDRWYRADDCKVVMVEPEEVLAQGAYMLLYTRVNPRPGPLTTPKDPPSKQRLQMRMLPSPANLVDQTENEMSSYPNGGMHHHDVLAGVKGTVETESDVSAMHKNMNDDLAPASPPREVAPISLMQSSSPGVGSFTESKETENGTPSSSTTNRRLENGTVVKPPKEMLSRGFLDRPYRMKPLEKSRRAPLPGIDQNPDRNTICTSNGVCDRLLPNGDALTERNGLVGVPLSNGESVMKEDSSSSIGSDMDHSSFSIGNGSLKEGEVSSINDGIDRMVVSNSDFNGEVSHSNGYLALVTNDKSEDGIDLETHEMVLSQEDGPTQNGLRHRVVHSQSQQVFKAADQNGFTEL